MSEDKLPGGNTVGAVRVGDVVSQAGLAVDGHGACAAAASGERREFDPAFSVLPLAADLERPADEVESLPAVFWSRVDTAR